MEFNISDHFQYLKERQEVAAAAAVDEGKVVDYPDESTLQLDIDTDENYKQFQEGIELLESFYPTLNTFVTRSKSGNRHIRVKLPITVSPLERIALQAALGSDGKRELLSVLNVRNGDPTPTVFFELPNYKETEETF